MDRQRMQCCLEQVAGYRASGQKANVWAEAIGVPLRALPSWSVHARRWQARLDGVSAGPSAAPRPTGFVAVRVAPSAGSASVRLELNPGGARFDLHWPLTHSRELAGLLCELGR